MKNEIIFAKRRDGTQHDTTMNNTYKNYEEQSKAYMQALIAQQRKMEEEAALKTARAILAKMHYGLDTAPAHTRRDCPPAPSRTNVY